MVAFELMAFTFRLFYLCTYAAFRLVEGLVRALPITAAFAVGWAGGEVLYWCLPRRRAVALRNLRLAFGAELSDARLHSLNRKHFRLLGANFLCGLKASTMPDDEIWKRVEADVPAARLATGWVALVSHLGNWEILSHLGGRFPEYRFGAVYQSQANPYIDRYLRKTRARSGIRLFDRRSEMLSCVRFLREGGVVGVLVDQGAGYAGLWTPLFGRLTSSSTLAATLSIRTGAPVVPLAVNTCGRAHWRVIISDAVYPAEQDAEALTARINRLLEEQIRRSPADWLWSHNRWKPLRPHLLFARDQRRVFFPPDFDRRRLEPFRVLIVSPGSADDAQATFPAVRAIKKGRPDIWLAVLAPTALLPAWRDLAEVHEVIAWNDADSAFAIASAIRGTARFDGAIFFARGWKTAVAVRLAGIAIRVGRPHGLASWLYNQHPAEPDQAADRVRVHLQMAQSIGANINQPVL